MQKKLPDKITFQWHITNKCNYRCIHCYQEDYSEVGVPFNQTIKVLDELAAFVINCKKENGSCKAHINITGGEPFLFPDILDLFEEIKRKRLFSFGILSNGLLLSEEHLFQLKQLKPRFVQISLEGSKITNDIIRGKGTYEKILHAIKTYARLKIPVMISFTANALNYLEFPHVVKIAKKYKAFKVWSDRYLPIKIGDELCLNQEQAKDYFNIIHQQQKKMLNWLSKTEIASNRALQFLTCGGIPYKCSAGISLLAIMPKGEVLPCRRLPLVIGNIFNDNLTSIYMKSDVLKKIHGHSTDCIGCIYKNSCGGGLKCLTYSLSNTTLQKDPHCWL